MKFTMEMAKANFFDPNKFNDPLVEAKYKILSLFGLNVMRKARKSIKDGGVGYYNKATGFWDGRVASKPGNPPMDHGKYRKSIVFVHDKVADEVIIGAVLFPNKSNRTIVPGVLEHGGEVEYMDRSSGRTVYKVRMQEARPHMKPAFDAIVKEMLPKLIENSIVQEGPGMLVSNDE